MVVREKVSVCAVLGRNWDWKAFVAWSCLNFIYRFKVRTLVVCWAEIQLDLRIFLPFKKLRQRQCIFSNNFLRLLNIVRYWKWMKQWLRFFQVWYSQVAAHFTHLDQRTIFSFMSLSVLLQFVNHELILLFLLAVGWKVLSNWKFQLLRLD